MFSHVLSQINDRLEFPIELNMYPYTKEGRAATAANEEAVHRQDQDRAGDGDDDDDDVDADEVNEGISSSVPSPVHRPYSGAAVTVVVCPRIYFAGSCSLYSSIRPATLGVQGCSTVCCAV